MTREKTIVNERAIPEEKTIRAERFLPPVQDRVAGIVTAKRRCRPNAYDKAELEDSVLGLKFLCRFPGLGDRLRRAGQSRLQLRELC